MDQLSGVAPSSEPFEIIKTEDPEVERKRLEDAARAFLVEQTHEVIIPSYAAWFDMSVINEIEKKSLPEFFNNRNRSKTPSVYKDYRDFMINIYRLNPIEYLTVTACRRNLAGDVCAIMRVHAFLEQWGLINYQIDLETRPSSMGPPFTGHFRVIADTPRGLQPFQPGPGSMTSHGRSLTESPSSQTKTSYHLELRKESYDSIYGKSDNVLTNGSKQTESGLDLKKQYFCFTCGVECSKLFYHSLKTKKFELCPNCYSEGRFPASFFSGDFVKMEETPVKGSKEDWSDQETLLLLEGLEMYDDDWNLVAEHVGTRTREQCVLRFLQLPIQDPYLESKTEDLGPLQYNRIPFSQADNPIMSVVAFLAGVVNPNIAAAAAQSSLEELTHSLKKHIDKQPDKNATPDNDFINDLDKPEIKQESSTYCDTNQTTKSEEMDVDEHKDPTSEKISVNTNLSPSNTIEKAASIALGTAAAKAQILVSHEEREISRLVSEVVKLQLSKLELKLQQFNELEQILEAERQELEKNRQQLYLDRLSMKKQIIMVQEQLNQAISIGGEEGLLIIKKINELGCKGPKLEFVSTDQDNLQVSTIPLSQENPSNYTSYQL
ncbi:hypothetical protein MERGE_001129 [Pneumocystis wakefieldiae]|uniref:SWIRM-domain-containing protein n=1 Tax=Pneumocystis wakefieldiae TaxID=38082 RepID=A0A899G1V2_9ASCO|nr:hypothetical protein MERGE_001129 [Pneumocystis wakefieldiae]